MKNIYTLLSGATLCLLANSALSQCDTTYLAGNQLINANAQMSGVYIVNGDFTVQPGVVITIGSFVDNDCGKLEIQANNIKIFGKINGDFAGYPGGVNGIGGLQVNSSSNHANSLTTCIASGAEGNVTVEGGKSGMSGQGSGMGLPGGDGGIGSGPKQYCGNVNDTYGMIAGGGGAGAGGGGAYGGNASNGASGGAGSAAHSATNNSMSSNVNASAGTSGTGGSAGQAYGTADGLDIDLGSGGAGAGGGGRSYNFGGAGFRGGNGGGLIILHAQNDIEITGEISANGEEGKVGGVGGSGNATDKCCSDGCDDCGESTFSAGAGSGGGSGAGSGGGILIRSVSASINGVLSAIGKDGGNGGVAGQGTTCNYGGNWFCDGTSVTTGQGSIGGKGGSSSGGRIKIFTSLCSGNQVVPTVNIAGGLNAGSGTYRHICESYLGLVNADKINFSIYPNPSSSYFTVDLLNGFSDNARITVVDLKGAVLSEIQMDDISTTVDVSSFQNGLYLITIQSGDNVVTTKFVKK